jgi:hypothetical protein
MTQDDIIKLMQQACDPDKKPAWHNDFWTITQEELERFAALVEAAEREACAALAEKTICDTHTPTGVNIYGSRAAKAIRARGTK